MTETERLKPLSGLTVIEMGQLIAGPFCGQMLAWFGADVIKIESPGKGDPLRGWRVLDESGTSFWWRSLARNKRSVTVNLNQEEGRQLIRQLLDRADVLIENFRPGKMESWGLGPDDIAKTNPALVYTRVSGYGQNGPYHTRPGFASACEAMGGFRHINGFDDRPPVRPNLSLGDTLAGMHAVIGTLLALLHRQTNSGVNPGVKSGDEITPGEASATGQVVDVSILESVYNMMEGIVPEYSGAGVERQPSGSTLTGIVPTNTYRCKDGRFVVIGGNGDSIFKRLMRAAGRDDLAEDSRLADNPGRVKHEAEIDEVIQSWASAHATDELLEQLDAAEVPSAPIYSVADMFEDPHFHERGMFEKVEYNDRTLDIPALHPRLATTPGETSWAGPELGEHTEEVLANFLDLGEKEIAELRDAGVL